MIPQLELAGARSAHARLCATLASLRDDDARRPSELAGWSVGHVLTHLARNADSLTGLFDAAREGRVGDQYPGGDAQRDGDIAAGAGRTAAELVADVRSASARLEQAWEDASPAMWALGTGRIEGREMPLRDTVAWRWREVEVHHSDLGLGFTWRDWSDELVDAELDRCVEALPGRLSGEIALRIEATDAVSVWVVELAPCARTVVRGTRHELLAWMLGRLRRDNWPALGPW